MTVQSATQICNGVLINTPSISSFSSIATDIKKIKRGALFVAINPSDILEAITLGAYGIIFDKPTQIIDSEIAWIKVDSLQDTLNRFLRFYNISSQNKFYLVGSFGYEVISYILLDDNVKLLGKSLLNNFNIITQNKNENMIFISKDKEFLDIIFPDYIDSSNFINSDYDIIKSTLFETSFRYKKRYYEFAKLPKFFLDDFIKILAMLDTEDIRYNIDSLEYTKHFHPVFVNKMLKAKEFGESDRVIIFEPNINYIDSSLSFLQTNLKWAECIYIFPLSFKDKYLNLKNSYFFNSKFEVIEFLIKTNFNFAYIAKSSYEDYKDELTREIQPKGLFYV